MNKRQKKKESRKPDTSYRGYRELNRWAKEERIFFERRYRMSLSDIGKRINNAIAPMIKQLGKELQKLTDVVMALSIDEGGYKMTTEEEKMWNNVFSDDREEKENASREVHD